MSAYIVDRDHIAYLVEAGRRLGVHCPLSWYHDGRHHKLNELTVDAVAQMLWSENVASVCSRYPDCSPDDLPGPGMGWPYAYGVHRCTLRHVEPVQVLKSLNCYEYQSCEHDGWKASEARAFCKALRSAATHALPGYEEAAWGAPKAPSVNQNLRRII